MDHKTANNIILNYNKLEDLPALKTPTLFF